MSKPHDQPRTAFREKFQFVALQLTCFRVCAWSKSKHTLCKYFLECSKKKNKWKQQATSANLIIGIYFCQDPPAEDDDDLDLFGDETEEDKKAAEEREAAKKPAKKKESNVN